MSSKARYVKLFIEGDAASRKTSTVGAVVIADFAQDGKRVLLVERPQQVAPAKPKRKPAPRKAASAAALPQSPEVQ